MDESRRVRLAPNVHVRRFENEMIVLDLQKGEYFSLNESGALMMDRLLAGDSIGGAVDDVLKELDAARDEVSTDLAQLVTDLLARGLVVVEPPAVEAG